MTVTLDAHFAALPGEGMAGLVDVLHGFGAVRVAPIDVPWIPLDVLLADRALLRLYLAADTLRGGVFAPTDEMPFWSIELEHVADASMLDRLLAVGPVDFAVCHRSGSGARVNRWTYSWQGPCELGARAAIGARVLALLDESTRDMVRAAGAVTIGSSFRHGGTGASVRPLDIPVRT